MDNFKISMVVFMALFFIGIGIYLIHPLQLTSDSAPQKANGEEELASGLDIPEDYEQELTVYWFWGLSCPVCSRQEPHIDRWERHPAVEIERLEVEEVQENRELLVALAEAYELERVAVPLTFIGDNYWIGFDERLVEEMEETIVDCATAEEKCPLPTDRVSPMRLP